MEGVSGWKELLVFRRPVGHQPAPDGEELANELEGAETEHANHNFRRTITCTGGIYNCTLSLYLITIFYNYS